MSLTGHVPKNLRTITCQIILEMNRAKITYRVRVSLSCPLIGSNYCVQEDAILETNIDEHRRLTLVNTCVEHLSNANR